MRTHTHTTALCGVFFCGHICRLGNPIKIIFVVFIVVLFMAYLLLHIGRGRARERRG